MTIVRFEVDPGFCEAYVDWEVMGDPAGRVMLLRDGTPISENLPLIGDYYEGGPSSSWTLVAENSDGQQTSATRTPTINCLG